MKIITQTLEHSEPSLASLADVVYFDIETTGLSSARNQIYLIGCALHDAGSWTLPQWFDNTGREEKEIISSFLLYISGRKTLIHYNGDRFDIPFLLKRMELHGLTGQLPRMNSIDLRKEVTPYRDLIGLPNCSQQAVESLFGTGRTDDTDGGSLIGVYRSYVEKPDPDALSMLLTHNAEDVRGLISLTPVLSFHDLPEAKLHVYKAEAHSYRGYLGDEKEELLLHFRSDKAIPVMITGSYDHVFLSQTGAEGLLRIPVYREEMKYFYAGYKDYYYLPEEDCAMHKSIASFADASHRVQATAQTCYTRKKSLYLPQWSDFKSPYFRREYQDPELFFELTDEMKRDRDFFCSYADYLFRRILKNGK